MKNMIKHDAFLMYLFTNSSLSKATQITYMRIVSQGCRWTGKPHLLDNTLQDIANYRLYLMNERHYSPASDTIIYNAFRHVYCVLLPLIDPEAAKSYKQLQDSRPRQQYRLPQVISHEDIQRFLDALPQTAAGHILREIYRTSHPFHICANGWKCSKQYAQTICAKTSRAVGLPYGFGLSGLRSASILHRLHNRENDLQIKAILDDCQLSPSQYARYIQILHYNTFSNSET
jgi:hypothetical protein